MHGKCWQVKAVAAALALAFGSPAVLAQVPSGAQAVHGQAQLARQGQQLVLTTANGAGTQHSAIDWQTFSIGAGQSVRFDQPSAASTSINRVLGGSPSALLGQLSSNGRLVLVNPAGIAVGAGAMVDTAGFTASTLSMSDADALAGRLRFSASSGAGAIEVQGRIVARLGDVVLIAPQVNVGNAGVVSAPEGAVVLAAGQKVELTGRGLEGIRFEVAAPSDAAVNLGILQGDAVGMFAARLRHSGLIVANGAAEDGGKLVLHAAQQQVDGAVRTAAAFAPQKDDDKGGGKDDNKGPGGKDDDKGGGKDDNKGPGGKDDDKGGKDDKGPGKDPKDDKGPGKDPKDDKGPGKDPKDDKGNGKDPKDGKGGPAAPGSAGTPAPAPAPGAGGSAADPAPAPSTAGGTGGATSSSGTQAGGAQAAPLASAQAVALAAAPAVVVADAMQEVTQLAPAQAMAFTRKQEQLMAAPAAEERRRREQAAIEAVQCTP